MLTIIFARCIVLLKHGMCCGNAVCLFIHLCIKLMICVKIAEWIRLIFETETTLSIATMQQITNLFYKAMQILKKFGYRTSMSPNSGLCYFFHILGIVTPVQRSQVNTEHSTSFTAFGVTDRDDNHGSFTNCHC